MSTTLSGARTEIASRAGEFLAGATTQTTNQTNVTDTNNLQFIDAYWQEATVLFTSGANNGSARRVQTYTGSSSTAVLYSNAPTTIASGVSFELYRRFTPADVKTALNRALAIGAPDFREKVRAVATATQDTLQYALPTSPDLRWLVAIEYQHYTQSGQSDWPYKRLDPSLYDIIEDFDGSLSAKKLQLRFNPETNRLIRFIYDAPLGTVSADTDVIHLDYPELEWLYTQSVAELWRIETTRTTDASRNAALSETARWDQAADVIRRRLTQPATAPLRRTRFYTV